MKEMVVVYGSHGYMKWAYWVDSIAGTDGSLYLVCVDPDKHPFRMVAGREVTVVSDEIHAKQLIANDLELHYEQERAQDKRLRRDMGWPT